MGLNSYKTYKFIPLTSSCITLRDGAKSFTLGTIKLMPIFNFDFFDIGEHSFLHLQQKRLEKTTGINQKRIFL